MQLEKLLMQTQGIGNLFYDYDSCTIQGLWIMRKPKGGDLPYPGALANRSCGVFEATVLTEPIDNDEVLDAWTNDQSQKGDFQFYIEY